MERDRVLVIEDDPRLMLNLKGLLERRGYEVLRAFTSVDGLNYAKRHRPDAIVLDLRFARGDEDEGLDVLRQLRDDPQMNTIPIIVYSQSTRDESDAWQWAYRLSADLVFSKDVGIYHVVERIEERIKRRKVEGTARPPLCPIDYDHTTDTVYIEGQPSELTLKPQDAKLLDLVVRNWNRIVTYDMIADFLETSPSNDAIYQAVRRLRQVLGDSERPHRYIKTIPQRGYRLVVRGKPNDRRHDENAA